MAGAVVQLSVFAGRVRSKKGNFVFSFYRVVKFCVHAKIFFRL